MRKICILVLLLFTIVLGSFSTAGEFIIGPYYDPTNPRFTGQTIINFNSGTIPADIAPAGSDQLRIVGANSKDAGIVIDAFGTGVNPRIFGRLARGLMLSPTAVQLGDNLFVIESQGYGATGYTSDYTALWAMKAAENWTDAAQGSYHHFEITLPTTLTKVTIADLTQEGLLVRASGNTTRGIKVLNTDTGASAYSSIYFGSSGSEADAIVALVGSSNSAYGGSRSFFLGTNTTAPTVLINNGVEVGRYDASGYYGTMYGVIPEIQVTDGLVLTARQCTGSSLTNYNQAAAITATLPSAASGLNFMAIIGTQYNAAFKLQRAGADTIIADGNSGKTYITSTNQAIGSEIACRTFQTGASAYTWKCTSVSGTWTTD